MNLFELDSEIIDRDDLKLLLKTKDSKGIGQELNFKDFCIWLGQSIHMNEGFYFRHDSSRNNLQEKYVRDRKIKFTTFTTC